MVGRCWLGFWVGEGKFAILVELETDRALANHGCENRAELALGWFGEYDSYDLLSLVILSHASPVSFSSYLDLKEHHESRKLWSL